MTIDINQFREEVVRPTLHDLKMYSPVAENLIMGTAAQESGFSYIKQLGGGPALGMFQVEPATAEDILFRYLKTRKDLRARFERAVQVVPPHNIDWDNTTIGMVSQRLVYDLRFGVALCRLRYWMMPEKMPARADDLLGLARYYKAHYNTPLGKATEHEFMSNYRRYVK